MACSWSWITLTTSITAPVKSFSRSANCYLIQFDRLELDQPQPPAVLYTLEELSSSCENCGQKCANLFKSRADMEQWIAWLNKPEKPAGQPGKVVHLKKPH